MLIRQLAVTANRRVCGGADGSLKTEINSKRKKALVSRLFSIYADQIDGITYL